MKRLLTVFICRLVLSILSSSSLVYADTAILAEPHDCFYPASAVVYVRIGETLGGNGTAFFISPTQLLTNAHIGRREFRLRISSSCFQSSKEVQAQVVSTWFDRNDISSTEERSTYPLVGGKLIPTSSDWALIEIREPLGRQLGYFGLRNQLDEWPGQNPNLEIIEGLACQEPPSNEQLYSERGGSGILAKLLGSLAGNASESFGACLLGYPMTARGELVTSQSSIYHTSNGEIGNTPAFIGNLNVTGGASGSPVFYLDPGTQSAVAVGILQAGLTNRNVLEHNFIVPIPMNAIRGLIDMSTFK